MTNTQRRLGGKHLTPRERIGRKFHWNVTLVLSRFCNHLNKRKMTTHSNVQLRIIDKRTKIQTKRKKTKKQHNTHPQSQRESQRPHQYR